MKIGSFKQNGNGGNVLVLTLVTTGLLGFVLIAYLGLVRSQNVANMRSQCWNQAIPVIEAGIEDALTHLNTHGLTNLACDNWNQLGNIYYLKRWVGDSYYLVTISNWYVGMSNPPIIESRGYVTTPTIMAKAAGPMLAVVTSPGDSDITTRPQYLGRGVRANANRDWLFAKGLVADGQIDLKGNNIMTDSFDSSDPLHSTAGQYDPTKRKANGDIATNSGLTNSMDVGNADIWGRVSTGPKGSVNIGPIGSVGDMAWHLAGRKDIQPGYATDDMNVDFPDEDPPFTSGYMTPAPGTNAGIRYDYLLEGYDYMMDTLSMPGSQVMYVKSNCYARLYVTGDVAVGGTASIVISPGATLRMYFGGAHVSLQGNGVLNYGGNATNFMYVGLPSNTELVLGGNSAFTGVIYAPNAALTLNGSGNSLYDFVGAAIVGSVAINGRFQFHYDEALAKYGPFRRYVVTRWDEMPPTEVVATVLDTTPQGAIH